MYAHDWFDPPPKQHRNCLETEFENACSGLWFMYCHRQILANETQIPPPLKKGGGTWNNKLGFFNTLSTSQVFQCFFVFQVLVGD